MKENLLVSFSGGRTSAYMTKYLLDNYKDIYNMIVVFANTGKEFEQTLDFIKKCDDVYGFNTIWVEAVTNHQYRKGVTAKVVNHETASRNGEPFEQMIKKHGLPNVVMPMCTRELKTYAIRAYCKQINFKKYKTAIGIRADEIDRIAQDHEKMGYIYPLVSAGITKSDINKFWVNNDFDLQLKGYEGNCDLCFKKSLRKVLTIIKEHPDRVNWWMEMEKQYEDYIPETRKQIGEKIRMYRNKLSLKELVELAQSPFELAKDDSKYYSNQLSLFDLDVSNGCVESCEPF